MRFSLSLCLWFLLSALCHADDLTVASSPDWRGLDDAQVNLIRSKFDPKVARLAEASRYSGGGIAILVVNQVQRVMNPANIELETAGFIHGLQTSCATVTDRQPARIGPLAGSSVLFENQANGQTVDGVAYLVFGARDMYAVSFYGKPGLTRDSPLVASYLARIKVNPAAATGQSIRLDPDPFGDLTTKILIGACIALLIFFGSRKLRRGSR